MILTIPLWLQFLSYIYLVIGFASAIYIVYDIQTRGHRQNMKIMNVVWPITAWYLGPLALWAYWHIGHLNLIIDRPSKDAKNINNNNNDNNNIKRSSRKSDNWSSSSFRHHIIRTHGDKNKPFWETIFVCYSLWSWMYARRCYK
ncbi:MAG TPA: hypothetical protein VI278_05180 [Nitrososphaeraceae archaeon]